ncbi:MAG: shikimate dehydrogenase [Lentisphaeria bacterium]
MTLRYGIIGWPVAHSKSPEMHNAGFKELKIDACYERFAVEPVNLAKQVSVFKEFLSGWNVTVPHKTAIIDFIDVLDPVAEAAQSVNTVVNSGGKLYGYSTDGYGLQRAVEEAFNFSFVGKHILFIGAGGAVQAAAVQFAQANCRKITILNRTLENAQKVAAMIHHLLPNFEVSVGCIEAELDDAKSVDLIIQGTSVELKGDAKIEFAFEKYRKDCVCMDMIYNFETPFLEGAKAHGMQTATGSEMLLYQGAKAFELWTKFKAPVSVMREALL